MTAADDGYTGTNFNRPGFQQMLSDIEMGYIYAVMVKDLSRLGRDYVSVGNYTDVYFPDHDVRFIAVNDGIDSEEGESEIAPFKNILNEMYEGIFQRRSVLHTACAVPWENRYLSRLTDI